MINWENKKLTQQPQWPDIQQFEDIISTIQNYPNLVGLAHFKKKYRKYPYSTYPLMDHK